MLKESYVTNEIAKDLKKLGFPQDYYVSVGCENKIYRDNYVPVGLGFFDSDEYAVCPLHIAQKWLRYEKCISVEITSGVDYDEHTGEYTFLGYRYYITTTLNHNLDDEPIWRNVVQKFYPSYEDALTQGIAEAIEILKKKEDYDNDKTSGIQVPEGQ